MTRRISTVIEYQPKANQYFSYRSSQSSPSIYNTLVRIHKNLKKATKEMYI